MGIFIRLGVLLFVLIFICIIFTQVIWPDIQGKPLWPYFKKHRRKQLDEVKNEITDVKESINIQGYEEVLLNKEIEHLKNQKQLDKRRNKFRKE
jgi:hypothetical protein